jgi:hypothetical protein
MDDAATTEEDRVVAVQPFNHPLIEWIADELDLVEVVVWKKPLFDGEVEGIVSNIAIECRDVSEA